MSYSKRTELFDLPYPDVKQSYDPEADALRTKTIDNLLFAATCGTTKALFEDGDYDIFSNGDDTYTLLVIPSPNYSVLGILKNRLFRSRKTITFDNLRKGFQYFIYIGYSPKMCEDPAKFVRNASLTEYQDKANKLLIATVDLRGDKPVINEDPKGKLYSTDILNHTSDTSNPHGRVLTQDIIKIVDRLFINDNEVCETIYKTVITNGTSGVVISLPPGKILVHANAMPMGYGLGDYYFDLEKKILFNQGKKGISVQLELRVK